jgi:hypothetical protein
MTWARPSFATRKWFGPAVRQLPVQALVDALPVNLDVFLGGARLLAPLRRAVTAAAGNRPHDRQSRDPRRAAAQRRSGSAGHQRRRGGVGFLFERVTVVRDLELELRCCRRSLLLHRVRDLVCEEVLPRLSVGIVVAGAEIDVLTDGERTRRHRAGGLVRIVIGVDANASELRTQPGCEAIAQRPRQRAALARATVVRLVVRGRRAAHPRSERALARRERTVRPAAGRAPARATAAGREQPVRQRALAGNRKLIREPDNFVCLMTIPPPAHRCHPPPSYARNYRFGPSRSASGWQWSDRLPGPSVVESTVASAHHVQRPSTPIVR